MMAPQSMLICNEEGIVVTVYYWSTAGWVKFGKFESMYMAKQFTHRYPKKAWKIEQYENLPNIIEPTRQHSKIQLAYSSRRP